MPELADRPTRWWLKPFARMGYGARGLVYLVVAFFALLTAFSGGENHDTREAIQFLTKNAAGTILTVILILGLAGYSLWRLAQATFDTDHHGDKPAGLLVRAGLLASCVVYAVLTVYTFSLWWGAASAGGGGGGFARWASGVIGERYAAIAAACIVLGVAVAHTVKAAKRKYRRYFEAPADLMRIIDPVAICGLVARGAVFLIIALLLYRRGFTSEKGGGGNTPGLRDALDYLLDLPAGHWLLAVVGLGLLAFAAYSFAEAAWRRIDLSDVPVPRT